MASMTAFSKVRTFEPKEMNLEQMLQVNCALWCMISVEKSANFWIKFSTEQVARCGDCLFAVCATTARA